MISFSGIDCSGKTTQIQLLTKELQDNNIQFQVVWSRGGYTPGISKIKDIIRRQSGNKSNISEDRIKYSKEINSNPKKRRVLYICSLIDLLLFYSISLRIIEKRGIFLICDRYIWDTYIDFLLKYPEYNTDKNIIWKAVLKFMVKPNPSYCLCIPAGESMRRSELKEEPFPEEIEIRQKRIELYAEMIEKNKWDFVIDATQNIDTVYEEIRSHITF